MFLEHQPADQIEKYKKLLNSAGSISKLFSESSEPYLVPRITENLFCKAFGAENLSRSDVSADAMKDGMGFGIKTFLKKNGRTLEKIAEFNSDHNLYEALSLEEKIKKIAELRNERLETTKRIYGLSNIIYHCITREVGKIIVYETPCPLIDIDNIKNIKLTGSTIQFSDPSTEYSFNISKSTLYKRFNTENILLEIPVRIIDDPYTEIEKLVSSVGLIFAPIKTMPHVFLPLYSIRGGSKNVPDKSGLNQWNASGRTRNTNEVYIPIPSWIHKKFPEFFPDRDKTFELTLPNRSVMNASLCQDGSKALMSNPNLKLGEWLLRDVLNLKEKELLTYEKLQEIGLDSVVVYKIDNEHYDIDFTKIGSYENFLIDNEEDNNEE